MKAENKNGHITNENTFMMCPAFLFVILGEMRISMIPKNQESLKKPYKSRTTCLFDRNSSS